MARQVLKWKVPVDDQFHPIGAGAVLHVGAQEFGVVTVWTDETPATARGNRAVRVYGTGQPVPSDLHALGSVIDGALVWHLFASTP